MNNDEGKSDLGAISEAIRATPTYRDQERNQFQQLERFLSTILPPQKIHEVGLVSIAKAWNAANVILDQVRDSTWAESYPEAAQALGAYKVDITVDILVTCFGMKE